MVILDRPSRSLVLTAAVAAGCISLASWYGYREIARDFREHLAVTLQSVLTSTQQSAHAWAEHERAEAIAWAEAPGVVDGVRQLLAAPHTKSVLEHLPAQARLRKALGGASHARGHLGFLVLAPDSITVAASDTAYVGRRLVPDGRPSDFAAVWSGASVVSVPRGGIGNVAGLKGTFSLAPLHDAGGDVIAVLALRLDPTSDFSELFQPSRVVPTAKAFAFDPRGRLLSTGAPSRLDTLDFGPPAFAPDAAGGPGAIPGHFHHYENDKVIGAWMWDESLGFGIATELDRKMAHDPLTLTQRILTGLSVLSMFLVVSVITMGRRSRQLETLLEGIPLGMLLVDRHGMIRRANSSAGKLFGYAPGDLAGRPVSGFLPPEFREHHAKLHAGYFANPTVQHMGAERKIAALHADGSTLALEITLAPIRIADDTFVLAMTWDIRHRLAMEKALHDRTEELARSNRDLEQFAYVASHDLRAPLRGIAHLADWLEAELSPQAGPESGRYLGLMRNRVRRMDGLLTSLLEYARASRGINPAEPVAVETLILDLAALLDWKPAFELRVKGSPPTLRTDSAALQQVLLNVLGNAIKHHDRPTGVVDLSWSDAGDAHEFVISDDGPGIPPDMRTKAFEMFQTLRPRDEVEGSGMGLALVKLITERRGGWVTIESNEPRGTTIRIHWPKTAAVRSDET